MRVYIYIVTIIPVTKANKAYYQTTIFPFFPYTAETKDVEIHRQ